MKALLFVPWPKSKKSIGWLIYVNVTESWRNYASYRGLRFPIFQQIVQMQDYWFLAHKSCIFNEDKRQNSSFYHDKQFFTFSSPFFAFPHFNRHLSRGCHFVSGDLKSFVSARLASFSLGGLHCHHHHHHISIEFRPPPGNRWAAENRNCIITWYGLHTPGNYHKTCPTG